MHPHINKTGRPNRWPSSASVLRASSVSLIFGLLLVSGIEAIVKQQHRSDDLQSPQMSGSNSAGSSGGISISSSSGGSGSGISSGSSSISNGQPAYQNHKSSSSQAQSQPSSQSGSSSVPNSISAVSAQQQQQQQQTSQSQYSSPISPSASGGASPVASSQLQSSQAQRNTGDHLNSYSNNYAVSPFASSNAKLQSQYASNSNMDNMAAAASSPEQSYQAAANSVNLALANSGIFGLSGPASSASSSSSSSSSGSSAQQSSSSVQSLNPLHYFYYPAKDTSSQSQAKASNELSSQASNNYQSYPSYADHLTSALSSIGSNPEAAASSQDPSYLPQPGLSPSQGGMLDNGNSAPQMYSNNNNNNNGPQMNGQQAHQGAYNGDLSAYSTNQQSNQQSATPQQGPGSISFNGPTNNQPQADYMNPHLSSSGHQSQQQQQQQPAPMGAFQANSLYGNQMGDLSTSNFGNNAGGLSSVASYMSPNQGPVEHSNPHDMFSNTNGLLGTGNGQQQFNSAASQLAPAAVSPPGSPSVQSSLFGAASSLFGNQQPSNIQQQQQPTQSLFSNQHYLNSFLSPQQFNQLTGQQPQLGPLGDALNMAGSNAVGAGANVAPQTTASGGSSKRFGIGSFIMPMLALAGLSLLIPTMSNIGTAVGRKKRSIEDRTSAVNRQQQIAFDPFNGASQLAKEISIGEYMDKIDRYYSIYKNAVESDDCLNRLICEFGDAVKDVTGKSAVVTVIEKLAPAWMTGKVHLFKEATSGHKEGKERCKKYICNTNKHH